VPTWTAEELHRRAVDLCISGRYSHARHTLDRAAARTTDPDLLARIAGTRALALQRTGAPAEAGAELERALATTGLTGHTRAILRGQLGALALYGGRLDEAERLLSAAISVLEDDDPTAAARVRMNRSLGRMQRRDLTGAAADLQWAAARFSQVELRTDAAHAQHNLGYIALLSGDLVQALDRMVAARPDAATTPVAGAVGDVDRAEVLRDAGQTSEAERILAHAATVFGAHRMPQSRAEAEFHLARSLLTHDPSRARTVARAASRRFSALGNDAWARRAEAVRLRAELLVAAAPATPPRGTGTIRDARAGLIGEVADGLRRDGFAGEARTLLLTAALVDPSRDGERLRLTEHAPLEVRLLTHEVRAARAARRGRFADARRHAGEGLDALSAWTAAFGSLDLQTSAAMHGAGLMYAGLQGALASASPDVIFEWSERARHLSQEATPLRPPPDPDLAAELAELRALRAQNPSSDWLEADRAAELRERARRRQWSGTAPQSRTERATLASVRSALPADTALLSYVYTGRALAVLVTDADGDTLVTLPPPDRVTAELAGLRADLDMSAAVRTGPLAAVVRRSLQTRLEQISALVLDPALGRTGRRRLVLTVPGLLAALPWAMLPGMSDRVFTAATSASRWLAAGPPRATSAPLRRAGFVVGPRVRRGEEEVARAGAAWPTATPLEGDRATVTATARLAATSDILHIAAHGRHTADNPLFSGLELTDGVLFGYDIDLIPAVPDIVVLSACEVGRSSVRWGEEAMGMTRIWLHAGAGSVIAAPVMVADDDACELLAATHEALAGGAAPAEALAGAAARTGIRAPFHVHGRGF
jgi:tetratricopeptide (TPR) repeat protein